MQRVLVVGDGVGVPRLLRHLDAGLVCGIMAAEIRPQYVDGLAELAAARGVPLLIQPRPSSPGFPDFVRRVAEAGPDLIICDSYSMLLPPEVLAITRAGAVNVHGGLVPEYRGSNPIQWAIIQGESEAGVTMHYMDGGFDTGDVIACRRVPLMFTDTWKEVSDRVAGATESLIAEQLPLILQGRASRYPQQATTSRHNPRRKPEDGRIDWSRSVRDVYNLIRALVSPIPGAFYVADGKTYVLDRYLTIAEVAALKQRLVPARLERGGCRIRVVHAVSNDPITIDVLDPDGHAAGRAKLTEIDYAGGQGRATIDLAGGACDAAAALEAVRDFARSELMIEIERPPR